MVHQYQDYPTVLRNCTLAEDLYVNWFAADLIMPAANVAEFSPR